MTLLGDAALSLNASLDYMAGIDVEVISGSGPVTLRAVKGRSATERFGEEQAYITANDHDFIFVAADYVAAVGCLPELEDTINWTDDTGTARRFQVGVDGVERQWDPVDQFGHLIRVHATEIDP